MTRPTKLATLGVCALMAAPALAAGPQQTITPSALPSTAATSPHAVVHAKSAPIRSEPSSRAHLVQTVFGGHAVEVIGKRGDWTHVRNGRHVGWMQSHTLEPVR